MGSGSRAKRVGWVILALASLAGLCGRGGEQADQRAGGTLHLKLRTRVEPFKASGAWQEVSFEKEIPVHETAIVICDMWDNHWCTGAARRVEVLARKMAPVIDEARARGIVIIHAPSETMDFYKDVPERRRMKEIPQVDPPAGLRMSAPPLPIDDSDGGCDTTPPDKFFKAWTRENAALQIARDDFISDDGHEIYSLLRQRGIKYLLIMGVHTNMCILNRSFAIEQMTRWGVPCILVRDLTDSMYNPKDRPYVAHDQGTALVVEHIEKYWCPTVTRGDLVQALSPMK